MGREHFIIHQVFKIVLLSSACFHAVASGGKMRFPESASSQDISEAGKVIDEILSASRAGRNLELRVGGKDAEPLALASDPQFRSLTTEAGKESEARNYVATKLCSLGLAQCSEPESRHAGGGDNYGLTNIRDVRLVQPVQLRPVGQPIPAIPLDNRPFGFDPTTQGKYNTPSFGNYPSENQNYPSFNNPQQGGVITSNDCVCVSINQCNSYDIVNPQEAGTGSQGVISGIGQPHHGHVGAGIDPRSKKTAIESNATVVEADEESKTRNVRSHNDETDEIISSLNSTNSTRSKRETDPRIINGSYRSRCFGERQVCCRSPRTPNTPNTYPSQGSNNYPSTGGSSYPNLDYRPNPPQIYPQRPVTNEYPQPSIGLGNGVCGKRNSNGINGRVLAGTYGANNAEFGEYPWQAALLKKDGANSIFVCGATIIDNRHLLTAAHCIKSHRPEELRVRLGEWDVNSENEFYPHIELDVAAIAIHPEYYAGNLINDIAIIKMINYVDFNKYPHISPICLPPPHQDLTGTRCYATGWGKDAFGTAGKFSRVLQEVDLPVINNYDCEQRLKKTKLGPDFTLHRGFVCAGGEPEKDACKGDGGGPLSCEVGGTWFVYGITSWGVGCGSYGVPGIYVFVPSYLSWIRQTIQ